MSLEQTTVVVVEQMQMFDQQIAPMPLDWALANQRLHICQRLRVGLAAFHA